MCIYIYVCVYICLFVCWCVCVCVTYILSDFYATTSPLPTSSVFPLPSPICPPSYTPTPRSSLIYDNILICPRPLACLFSILSFPFFPRSNHTRARAVSSLLYPSALVADKCAPLFHKGRGGAGCLISLLLVTVSPAQSCTFTSIAASACS